MQSKTSFFNRTLFRKNLSRYWPLWGFASFVGFLAPAALLVRVIQSGETSVAPLRVREIYYYLVADAVPIVSIAYAILCAMAVWSYLYNARSVGMMHSLPIRREGLFLTNLLSGLAMMAIPYLVAGGLGTLLFACCGGFDAWGTLATILAVIGQSVTFFGLATFCAFLTGNIFALPVLYFLLNFLAPLGDWLCNLFARGFLFGFTADYSGTVDFLCPMVYLTQRLYVNSEYETVRDSALEYQNRLTSVTLENAWLIAAYAAAGLVFLALAYLLYRRRESERAGDVVAVRVFRPVFRFGVAALSASWAGGSSTPSFGRASRWGTPSPLCPWPSASSWRASSATMPPPCSWRSPSGSSGAAPWERCVSWPPALPSAPGCAMTSSASSAGSRTKTRSPSWRSTSRETPTTSPRRISRSSSPAPRISSGPSSPRRTSSGATRRPTATAAAHPTPTPPPTSATSTP